MADISTAADGVDTNQPQDTITEDNNNANNNNNGETKEAPKTPRVGGKKVKSGNTTPRVGTAASTTSHHAHDHKDDKTLARSRVGTAPTASSRRYDIPIHTDLASYLLLITRCPR